MRVTLLIIGLLLINSTAWCQEIRLRGSGKFSYRNADIQAGDDFASEAETSNNIYLEIKKAGQRDYWSVLVSKNDINWDNKVKIFVRRTSSGNGNGSVYGGLNYSQINNLSSNFLTGNGKLDDIDIQYKITGVDVTLPAQRYYTDIVYTLYEN